MSKEKNLNKFISELIKEVQDEIDEATTSGDIAGYETPNAFGDDSKKSKKKTKDVSTQAGYTVVNESELKLGVKYTNKIGKEGFIQTGGSKNPKDWIWFDGKTNHPYNSIKHELKPANNQKKTGFGDYLNQGGRVWDHKISNNPNSISESEFAGQLAGDTLKQIVKKLSFYKVTISQNPNRNWYNLYVPEYKNLQKVQRILKDIYGIKSNIRDSGYSKHIELHGDQMLEDKIPGGLSDGMSIEDIANKHNVDIDELVKQFKKGIKVEMEHTTDVKISKEICLDHLFEDPKYYDKLATIENESVGDMRDIAKGPITGGTRIDIDIKQQGHSREYDVFVNKKKIGSIKNLSNWDNRGVSSLLSSTAERLAQDKNLIPKYAATRIGFIGNPKHVQNESINEDTALAKGAEAIAEFIFGSDFTKTQAALIMVGTYALPIFGMFVANEWDHIKDGFKDWKDSTFLDENKVKRLVKELAQKIDKLPKGKKNFMKSIINKINKQVNLTSPDKKELMYLQRDLKQYASRYDIDINENVQNESINEAGFKWPKSFTFTKHLRVQDKVYPEGEYFYRKTYWGGALYQRGYTAVVSFSEDDFKEWVKDKTIVVESINENRWLELKNDESMHPHKKLSVGLKELRNQLKEVEQFLGWYNKLKNINELDSDNYWKRTNSNIYKIKERIVNIAKTLKEIEK
jgi:hypothetical protein